MKRFKSLKAALAFLLNFVLSSAAILASLIIWLLMKAGVFPKIAIRFFIILPLGSIFIGFILSLAISSRVLKPITELIGATKAISEGDYTVRVSAEGTRGELAELVKSFNTMAEALCNLEMFNSDFINTFSHEFKTPMVSMRGFAKRLKSKNISEEQRDEYANIIIDETDRLTRMSSNILLLAKCQNLKIVPEKSEFSLDEQIRKSMQLFQHEWLKKDLTFDGELQPVNYYGNEELMSHIWTNLLSNAIKFSPKGSVITVSLAENDVGAVTVKISDEGKGMDEETLKHIFEKFYQADSSHAGVGNGLGLSIVKLIVDLSGGKIEVESKENMGTTFIIKLPATKE